MFLWMWWAVRFQGRSPMPGLDGQSLYQLASNQSADLARKMVFVTEDTANQSSKEF
tara:strand:+ start:271 stop:438 length:168 start_codon:yes stop_codon:yes gene_type:complete